MTARKTGVEISIVYLDPKKLNPAAYNPREMTETARAKLKASLEQNAHIAYGGLVDPIIVQKKGKKIIGGHQRTEIAIELDHAKVPVVLLPVSDVEAMALNVALNNPELAGHWDYPKLELVLKTVRESDIDELRTGFDTSQINAILDGWQPPSGEDIGDYDPDLETWVVKISGVSAGDKDAVVSAVDKALDKAGLDYECKAF